VYKNIFLNKKTQLKSNKLVFD